MYPRLINSDGALVAILDNIIADSASIKRVVNGEFTLTFEAFEKELKSEYFDPSYILVIEDQSFDLKYYSQLHSNELKYSLEYEHVNYRLLDYSYDLYTYIGTPSQILNDILSGTEFSVGTVAYTDVVTISTDQEITKKELIYELANSLGGEVDYSDQGFTIDILDTIGQDLGFEVRFGKNALGITKTMDYREGLVYYEVDLAQLKNTNEYKNLGYEDLEKVDVGDTIAIFDSVTGLNVVNRVVSIEYNPIFSKTLGLEIANKLKLITDKIQDIETEAKGSVKLNRAYNDVTISYDYGVRSTRSDQLARTTIGGGTLALESGDGSGSYDYGLYFDVIDQKYKFIGVVEGTEFVGGSISIGSNFNVTNAGVLTASGAVINGSITVTGGSGISNFSDSGDLASLDKITETHITDGAITTPKIRANAVTANEINVSNLSAISANLGIITGGSLNIGSGRFSVNSSGYLYASGANISGDVDITSGSITIGDNFSVNNTGILTASGATINGRIKSYIGSTLVAVVDADTNGGYFHGFNAAGNQVMQIGTSGDQTGLLLLNDSTGGGDRRRVQLATDEDGGSVGIFTGDSVWQISMSTDSNGGFMNMYTSMGHRRLSLRHTDGNGGRLILYSGTSNIGVDVGSISGANYGYIQLNDHAGADQVMITGQWSYFRNEVAFGSTTVYTGYAISVYDNLRLTGYLRLVSESSFPSSSPAGSLMVKDGDLYFREENGTWGEVVRV